MQALACFGWVKTELRVTGVDGAALKSTDLQIFVKSSRSEQSLESTSEFHALDAALTQAKETVDTAQQAVDTAAGLVQTADSTAANASKQAEAAQSAVSAANAAAAQFDSMVNDLAAADAEITKQMDKFGGLASYDNSVQTATFGSLTVPKSGTTLQVPAAVRDVGQITQDIFNNAEIGYSYVGSVSPDLSNAPLSQWGMMLCCASGILCAQMVFMGAARFTTGSDLEGRSALFQRPP